MQAFNRNRQMKLPRRATVHTAIVTTIILGGCFEFPDIKRDEPTDVLPYIDTLSGVSPSMGGVIVNLTLGGKQQFFISGYGDANLDQELYHRIVIDYRLAGVTANPITSTFPRTIPANARASSMNYEFQACSVNQIYPDAIKDGKIISFYFILADEQFMHLNQLFTDENFAQPFKTRSGRPAVWVHWSLYLVGQCPAL